MSKSMVYWYSKNFRRQARTAFAQAKERSVFLMDMDGRNKKYMENITLKLSGLHCTSCATNIDLTLEDLPGVIEANTNYAKSELKLSFDPTKTSLAQIKSTIESLGYSLTLP
jgi:copper chaperone CopZ